MNRLLFLLSAFFPLISLADTIDAKPLVTQTLTYHTAKAKETYLVWKLNTWKDIPPQQYWPKHTFLKDGMAYSKMLGDKDSFSITITLPYNSNLVFMFWVPINNKGDSTNAWDTNEDLTYFSDFTENKRMSLTDWGLVMPSFNILNFGWKFFIASVLFSGLIVFAFRKRFIFSKKGLLTGLLLAALVIDGIIRMQMNRLRTTPHHIFGAVFSDMVWFFFMCSIFLLLMFLVKNYRRSTSIIGFVFAVSILASTLFSLCNIEIVNVLGRPVNYQWLYYSDFMRGDDAKNAIAKNLDGKLILNLILLILSLLIFAVPFSILPKQIISKVNKAMVVIFILVLPLGYYEAKAFEYAKGKVENPCIELIASSIISERSSKMFSLKISNETKTFIEKYHSVNYSNRFDSNSIIKNIVLFVIESTPHRYVSIYDSTFNATPNLKKWKNISSVYTNVYAHMPATVYSMASINSGVYPLISHVSLIANYPNNTIPSISSELSANNWSTSLLFSADLKYSNIGIYAKKQGFMLTEDNTSMPCNLNKFGTSNTFIDAIDDKCLINRYFGWSDSIKSEKKFSVLWTNQTHYPYNFKGNEVRYSENKDLNHYLNALRNTDEAFRMLMEGLKARGLLESTLVIVTADHGEAFGTHDQIIHASKIYEENVHVPFIMYNPTFFKGNTNNEVWGLIDIPPTITHLVGIKKPVEWEGRSMLSQTNPDRTFFIVPFSDFLFGTKDKSWKYIYNATTDKDELYNLGTDLKELKNVAGEYPEIVRKEFEMISAWVQYHNNRMSRLGIAR